MSNPRITTPFLLGAALWAVTGCTSLTQSDDIRVSKDKPVSQAAAAPVAVAPPAAKPSPAGANAAVNQARGGAPKATIPKKKGKG